jgi:large subunit ribosomal protein L22
MTMTTRQASEKPIAEASLRYYRCSAQKARLVVDQIRGKGVNEALGVLHFSPKVASKAIEKLLRSAVANAERGGEKVDADTLYVGQAYVGPGPSFKRFRGRAFGRAFRILHRTCHITVKLKAKAPPIAPGKSKAQAEPRGSGD